MCVEILMPDGKVLTTFGEASRALGVLCCRDAKQPCSDVCLCPVNVEETATANGYVAVWDESRLFVTFYPRGLSPREIAASTFRNKIRAFLVDLHALTIKHGVKIDADTFDMPVLVPLGDDEHGGRYEVDFFSPGVDMAHGIAFEKGTS